ncbi:MAG: aminoacyl-tRNA hydrolase [Bacteroidetes bacterium CG_4_8_14_3_um_filter_31_14]|nr:MAG: aminoacyl-tRNA hydrolase [Bacteroidetes bacterium CG_4_8_14_3_um_filter_31_14]
MKYLIAGLGNIGSEYSDTRHNIGFMVLDALAKTSNAVFETNRLCFNVKIKHKGRTIILIKPTTYMNLSGKAIKYWLEKEKIYQEKLLVILDDIALPFGTIRIKPNGSNGGHNGLKSIDEMLGNNNYARMRFGVGNDFSKGRQADYVLSNFTTEEKKQLSTCIEQMKSAILNFGLAGIQDTMSRFNGPITFPENH